MNKILIIGPFPEPVNGCSLANAVLFENLLKRGLTVDKINTAIDSISTTQGTKFSLRKVLSFLSCYREITKIYDSSVVYSTPGQTLFGILKYAPFYSLCIFLKIPYIIHVHGNYLGTELLRLTGLKKKIFSFFISNASAGIVLSESLKNNFDNLLDKQNIFVVKNFVQNEFFVHKLNKRFDKIRILYLSNLMLEKGIFELLAASKILLDRQIDFELAIAGKIEKGIESEFYILLESLGDRATYLGAIYSEKKFLALQDANVFVLPTYYTMEGQPISILEALATGNVVISTFHGGIPDIISEDNGYLVEPRSVNQLVNVLSNLVNILPQVETTFTISNINYAKENFTEDQFVSNILNIINGLSTIR